jgi:3-dehydro-L-gulonate 2-dehydrogenase
MQNQSKPQTLLIPAPEVTAKLYDILVRHDVPEAKAKICAEIFTNNSLEGIYSHGINRFAKFISFVQQGVVKPAEETVCVGGMGAIEQWDGRSGIGVTNAFACANRAMELAKQFGMGCVAQANTNHWMRAGTYSRHAASLGFVFIGWGNTNRNTPAWGALDPRLGNNPLTIAVPFEPEPIVLDMAMSQYSYGALDNYRMKGEKLPLPGGFDESGNLSTDPEAILQSRRTLPIGYWKGSGLSLLLDILATVLSGGLSVSQISKQEFETNVSQIFIAFHLKVLQHHNRVPQLLQQIIEDLHESIPQEKGAAIRYPGERISKTRNENLSKGIPILKNVWDEILALG